MNITLESLGLDAEQLRELVVNRACLQLMESVDAEGESVLMVRLQKEIQVHLNARVAELAAEHVLPRVSELVDDLTLQSTNEWGQSRGERLTFIEYLVARTAAYLSEKVDHSGKSKAEGDRFHWDGKQTRVTHLVHQHLQYSIETAMKAAMKNANDQIVEGIRETVKLKLGEIAKTLKVSVKV